MAASEEELCRKLMVTSHLSVPERQALPGGRARFSVIRKLIAEALGSEGWFPRRVEPGEDIGSGAVLESRGGDLWLHQQHEAGVGRFGPIQSRRVSSVEQVSLAESPLELSGAILVEGGAEVKRASGRSIHSGKPVICTGLAFRCARLSLWQGMSADLDMVCVRVFGARPAAGIDVGGVKGHIIYIRTSLCLAALARKRPLPSHS